MLLLPHPPLLGFSADRSSQPLLFFLRRQTPVGINSSTVHKFDILVFVAGQICCLIWNKCKTHVIQPSLCCVSMIETGIRDNSRVNSFILSCKMIFLIPHHLWAETDFHSLYHNYKLIFSFFL